MKEEDLAAIREMNNQMKQYKGLTFWGFVILIYVLLFLWMVKDGIVVI